MSEAGHSRASNSALVQPDVRCSSDGVLDVLRRSEARDVL